MKPSIRELEEKYELGLDKVVAEIKKRKATLVLLQFPDGLKPYACVIVEELEKKTDNVGFLVWLGSCYGACDIPEVKGVDMVVQFGHSAFGN